MNKAVPIRHLYAKCDVCKTIYESSSVHYKINDKHYVRQCSDMYVIPDELGKLDPCPVCGNNNVTTNYDSISAPEYWITKIWRIFWHGRIDKRNEELDV